MFPDVFVCDKCNKAQKGREVGYYFHAISSIRIARYFMIPFLILFCFVKSEILWIPLIVNIPVAFFVLPRLIKVKLPSRQEVSDDILLSNLKD